MSTVIEAIPMPKPQDRDHVQLEKQKDRYEFRLTDELRRRIRAQARRFSQTEAAYIKLAVIQRLERDEAEQPAAPKIQPRPKSRRPASE